MNRIAVRLSFGLLCAALILLTATLLLVQSYVGPAASDDELQARVLSASKSPTGEREALLAEIASDYDVPVAIVRARDVQGPGGPRPVRTRQGAGFARGVPLHDKRPPGPDSLLVRIAESDELIQVGPFERSPWPLFAVIFGAGAFVVLAGVLLARPLIRRLTALQDTAMRIARGELDARAEVSGGDAIGEYAAHFNQMAERNQALLEGQRDLMRGVSHELRTPVARIRFAIELARESAAGPDRERHLAAIDADLSEIDELIHELLLVDRLSSGALPAASDGFEVVAIVRGELDRERVNQPRIDAALHGELAGATVVARGSERLFRRVVRNLVSNAFKHARARVTISVAAYDGTVTITIDDDGVGIPAAARSRVLEPFVRLDESRSRELGGVGLGLTIVDRILRATGGALQIGTSELGGARVAFTWPCEPDPSGMGNVPSRPA